MNCLKAIIALLFFVLIYVGTSAQTTFTYSYDDAGNRNYRGIVLKAANNVTITNDTANNTTIDSTLYNRENSKDSYSDTMGDMKVNIYPNPTKGVVKFEFTNIESFTNATFSVYTNNGQLLFTQNISNSEVPIDLSEFTPGNYIVKANINNSAHSWLIIKE